MEISSPLATAIVAIVGMLAFRRPLERLIDRVQKVSKDGFEAGQVPTQGTEQKAATANDLLKDFDNALLVKRESEICAMLEKAQLASPSADRERVLLRHLAGTTVMLGFERAYAFIWISQLSLLHLLNTLGEEGMPLERAQFYFKESQPEAPDAPAPPDAFDRWLRFLEAFSLVERTEAGVRITLDGKEFLKYLIHQGYNLHKAF